MPVLGGDLCSPPSKMSDSKEVSLTITSWIRYKGELPTSVVCWILERNAGIPSREAVRTDRQHVSVMPPTPNRPGGDRENPFSRKMPEDFCAAGIP